MERKTIGSFIAALRRANGMTQKELADKLNVSDKTVSRWERDDGAPDLSLIPVIAEIFGVSCDELLRGEKKPAADQTEMQMPESEISAKGEKQRRLLLQNAHARYMNHTLVAVGVSGVGLICAMAINFGALRAYIGFFVGLIFYLTSVILQAVYVNGAMSSVSDDSVSPEENGHFRRRVIVLAERSFALTALLLGFTLPLVIFPNDAYVGLTGSSCLLYGMIFAAVAGVLYALICRIVHHSLFEKGVFTMSEPESAAYQYNYRLQRICALTLAATLLITAVMHIASTEIWGPYSLMEGQVFTDYESFAAYMAQPVSYDRYGTGGMDTVAAPLPDSTIYYDENGNEISEEEAHRRTLHDADGNVIFEYLDYNESVCSIRYTPTKDSALPITVCTYDDLRKAEAKAAVRHGIFAAVYCAEIAAAAAVYMLKRKK